MNQCRHWFSLARIQDGHGTLAFGDIDKAALEFFLRFHNFIQKEQTGRHDRWTRMHGGTQQSLGKGIDTSRIGVILHGLVQQVEIHGQVLASTHNGRLCQCRI
jgi:hypothetical protein